VGEQRAGNDCSRRVVHGDRETAAGRYLAVAVGDWIARQLTGLLE
jgi:hypothetical protein